MANPIQIPWAHLTAPVINQSIQLFGFQIPEADNANRETRVAFLIASGITATQCMHIVHPLIFNHQPAAVPIPPAPVPAVIRRSLFKIAQQGSDEQTMKFINRADICLRTAPHDDEIRMHSLLNASGPELNLVIQNHLGTGVIRYQDLIDVLRREYKVSKSTALYQFEIASYKSGETFHNFGRRLLELFMDFMDRPLADFAPLEYCIKHALFVKLIQFVPQCIRAEVITYFSSHPNIPWYELLTHIDCEHTARLPNPGQSRVGPNTHSTHNRTNKKLDKRLDKQTPFCSTHGEAGHWTRECRNPSKDPTRRPRHDSTIAAIVNPADKDSDSENSDQVA